jgi:transcriptional regulator with GAF, ATPase, and Fis domain
MGKQIDSIPSEMMAAFQWHSWPGNIRELQNLVERAVILSRDGALPNPLQTKQTSAIILGSNAQPSLSAMNWEDSDRALVMQTLEQTGWIVGGPRGAAAKLGLKRTTLLAKMRRLGISRPISEEGTSLPGVAREDAEI